MAEVGKLQHCRKTWGLTPGEMIFGLGNYCFLDVVELMKPYCCQNRGDIFGREKMVQVLIETNGLSLSALSCVCFYFYCGVLVGMVQWSCAAGSCKAFGTVNFLL